MKRINYTIRVMLWALCGAASITFFGSDDALAQISSTSVVVHDTSSISGATTAASNTSFCTGGSTTLSISNGHLGSGTPVAKWVWYADAAPTTGSTSIGDGASLTVSPTNTGTQPITKTYYVRAEGGYCNHTTAALPVTVTINPIPTATALANSTVCNSQSVAATSVSSTPTGVTPGVTFNISGGASIGLADATNVSQVPAFTASNTGTAPVTATISVTPVYQGCTGTAVTYTITVNPTPVFAGTLSDITKCEGNTVSQVNFSSTATGGSGVTYAWTNTNTAIGLAASGSGNIASFTAANDNTPSCTNEVATIAVTPTFTNNSVACSGTPQSFTVTVRPKPTGNIAALAPELCEGSAVQLSFNATCGTGSYSLEIEKSGVSGAQTYSNVANGGTVTIPASMITPNATNTYDLIKITDANGCSNPVTP